MSALRIEIVDYLKDYGFGRYAVRTVDAVKSFDFASGVLEYVKDALMGKKQEINDETKPDPENRC